MTNYIHTEVEDDQIRLEMYIDDNLSSWIFFNESQTEGLINLLKKNLKKIKKNKVSKNKMCKSNNPDNMCDECDCWKMTRAYCS